MKLLIFRSLWTNGFRLEEALLDCRHGVYDGVEGPLPHDISERKLFAQKLKEAGVPFIAEVTTAGGYVPERWASVNDHLADFRAKILTASECNPLFITSLAGCDAWPLTQSVDFFGQAIAIAAASGQMVSFETHRSRSIFNPWITRDLLLQLPELRLTCDYSHWCCVCERLIDTEPEILALCAERAQHVHARVGYDQGPQVPNPAAPEYLPALEAHERWWKMIWAAHARQNRRITTMTPEFGPDGYLQQTPFTRNPVADLDEVNRWIAQKERMSFSTWKEVGV